MNAITQGMLVDLAAAFRSLRGDPSVRAAVITATGRKAFSTGINLGDAERVFKMDENDLDNDIVHQMESCPFPVAGAINGVAINAGFEIALACDILMCAPNASFLDTHAKLGILPSWGLSQKLRARWAPASRGWRASRVGPSPRRRRFDGDSSSPSSRRGRAGTGTGTSMETGTRIRPRFSRRL